ncbi:alpha/beta hydrolase fold protein, partial [mine drainage metagenome]
SCAIADQCRMLNEFVLSLGFKKFGLVGNSYGGWISLRYTLAYEPKPEYLVLIDSAGLNPSIGEGDPEVSAAFVDRVMTMSRYNRREVIEKMIENNSHPEERIRSQDLRNIRSRTLIIWGELDALIPPAYGKKMQEYITGSSLQLIPGAGHVPQTARYAEIASLITSFIRE